MPVDEDVPINSLAQSNTIQFQKAQYHTKVTWIKMITDMTNQNNLKKVKEESWNLLNCNAYLDFQMYFSFNLN